MCVFTASGHRQRASRGTGPSLHGTTRSRNLSYSKHCGIAMRTCICVQTLATKDGAVGSESRVHITSQLKQALSDNAWNTMETETVCALAGTPTQKRRTSFSGLPHCHRSTSDEHASGTATIYPFLSSLKCHVCFTKHIKSEEALCRQAWQPLACTAILVTHNSTSYKL